MAGGGGRESISKTLEVLEFRGCLRGGSIDKGGGIQPNVGGVKGQSRCLTRKRPKGRGGEKRPCRKRALFKKKVTLNCEQDS